MFLKVVVAVVVLAAILSMSGCCSCCSYLAKGNSDDNSTINDGHSNNGVDTTPYTDGSSDGDVNVTPYAGSSNNGIDVTPQADGSSDVSDVGSSTPTGDASDLIGHWIWGQSTSDGYTLAEMDVDFYENGTFIDAGVFHKYGGGGISYTIVGQYHVSGNSIKYTRIIKYYYKDLNQPDHTTTNIADTSGTYRIERENTCDTVYLQADGLWDSETALYRYQS